MNMTDILLSPVMNELLNELLNEFDNLIQTSVKKALSEEYQNNIKSDNSDDERITRKDIKRIYKVSYPTIHSLMKQGLPFEKIGRKTLYKRSLVDKYFSQRKG